MRIIPVIDLRGGRAVRGRSGDRASYRPVESRLAGGLPLDLSEPRELLAAYASALRPDTIYVADLDRIAGSGSNDAALDRMLRAAPQCRFLWDGGFAGAAVPPGAPRSGRIVPVVGTETLRSIEELRPLRRPAIGERPVLSLDLREEGIVSRSPLVSGLAERDLLHQARRRGIRTVILLLLDRVGTGLGPPLDRLRRLREAAAGLELLAGGGIASIDDLERLREAGFSGALVATALHEGTIRPSDLERRGWLR